MPLLYMIFSVFIGVIAGVAVYFLIRLFAKRRIAESLRTALFLVKIARPEADGKAGSAEHKDLKSELAHFEQLLGGLVAIKKPFAFEIAVPHVGEEIHFYFAVPKLSAEIAAKQIQGLWNGASIEPIGDDFNIFNMNGATAAAYVALRNNFALPIRTYAELGIDSFESILGSFSKINEIGEGAALQVVVRPASKEAKKSVQKYIELLKKGEPIKKVFGTAFPVSFVRCWRSVQSENRSRQAEKKVVVDEEAVKALRRRPRNRFST